MTNVIMSHEEFVQSCGRFADEWEAIRDKSPVYSVIPDEQDRLKLHMQWDDMRNMFTPSCFPVSLSFRRCKIYPWEAQIGVAGVTVFALLTEDSKESAIREGLAIVKKEA